eukprot:TRINITY_DN322_c0_g2_i1.p1 TRINITY_DN322_c0_g2~~TRINITY_DN322_c0_g2_i1.p1  ORF type:complete len:131 (-),score=40.23 TRINITY_DN322_c0_g2_i1:444-836(-)
MASMRMACLLLLSVWLTASVAHEGAIEPDSGGLVMLQEGSVDDSVKADDLAKASAKVEVSATNDAEAATAASKVAQEDSEVAVKAKETLGEYVTQMKQLKEEMQKEVQTVKEMVTKGQNLPRNPELEPEA